MTVYPLLQAWCRMNKASTTEYTSNCFNFRKSGPAQSICVARSWVLGESFLWGRKAWHFMEFKPCAFTIFFVILLLHFYVDVGYKSVFFCKSDYRWALGVNIKTSCSNYKSRWFNSVGNSMSDQNSDWSLNWWGYSLQSYGWHRYSSFWGSPQCHLLDFTCFVSFLSLSFSLFLQRTQLLPCEFTLWTSSTSSAF